MYHYLLRIIISGGKALNRSKFKYFRIVYFLIILTSFILAEKPKYKDPSFTVEQRLNDLLDRMTLEEKVAQMCQYVGVEHLKRSENNLSKEELEKSDAHGIYEN